MKHIPLILGLIIGITLANYQNVKDCKQLGGTYVQHECVEGDTK